MEKTRTKTREPEPEISNYEFHIKYRRDFIQRQNTGKLLIKASERNWAISRQSKSKTFMYPNRWPEHALQDWQVFMQDVVTHSGKHRHQGGVAIFVLEGRGYTVVNGVRMDWKKGDLILLPLIPGGVEHQHFNLEPGKPCRWLANIYVPMYDQVASFTEQIEVCPLYSGATK